LTQLFDYLACRQRSLQATLTRNATDFVEGRAQGTVSFSDGQTERQASLDLRFSIDHDPAHNPIAGFPGVGCEIS
jgi:hypothetical protein